MNFQTTLAALLIGTLSVVVAADPAPAPAAEKAPSNDLDYRKDGDHYLLVLKPGQKVIESLMALEEKENLPGARFTAIGAVKNIDIAYYDLEAKEYKPHTFAPSAEVLSLNGSLGHLDGKPVVHAHISFAGPDYIAHGGHLREAEVSLTLELFVTPTTERIERELNSEFPAVRTINLKKK